LGTDEESDECACPLPDYHKELKQQIGSGYFENNQFWTLKKNIPSL